MRPATLVWKSTLLSILCLASWVQPRGASADAALTTLHSFAGSPDGAYRIAGLIFDKSGALYGTTSGGGGARGFGAVFKLTPPKKAGAWAETVLHSFTGNDGELPYFSGLIFDKSGALYGTTFFGGDNDYGTVFMLAPSTTKGGAWTERVLHSFNPGSNDGVGPYAGLIFDKSGALYGTTGRGGAYGHGTVFNLTPPTMKGGAWTESVLYSFAGNDGANAQAGLIFDKSGALYGTTVEGGAYGSGTVFMLAPPTMKGGAWTESVLHSFAGNDGVAPFASLIFDKFGALYGTTGYGGTATCFQVGCGTVFKLAPPTTKGGAWTESVLHNFTGTNGDGNRPISNLVFDKSGALYGTTYYGGAVNDPRCNSGAGCGVVFKLTLPTTAGGASTESVLHSFTAGDGAYPSSGVIFDKSGALYGTTFRGGPDDSGTVFKLEDVDGGEADE